MESWTEDSLGCFKWKYLKKLLRMRCGLCVCLWVGAMSQSGSSNLRVTAYLQEEQTLQWMVGRDRKDAGGFQVKMTPCRGHEWGQMLAWNKRQRKRASETASTKSEEPKGNERSRVEVKAGLPGARSPRPWRGREENCKVKTKWLETFLNLSTEISFVPFSCVPFILRSPPVKEISLLYFCCLLYKCNRPAFSF